MVAHSEVMSVSSPAASVAVAVSARVAALGAAGAAAAYVGAVDPNEPGHYPACPLLRYTGVLCPGCGGLRAVHALVHGDVVAAVAANAAVVAAAVLLAAGWVLWCVRPGRALSVPPGWVRAGGVVLLVFSVLRNLPCGTALAP